MANGEHCRHCGWQETEHIYPELCETEMPPKWAGATDTSCDSFESEVTHWEFCEGKGDWCGGDCIVAAIEYAKRPDPLIHYGPQNAMIIFDPSIGGCRIGLY